MLKFWTLSSWVTCSSCAVGNGGETVRATVSHRSVRGRLTPGKLMSLDGKFSRVVIDMPSSTRVIMEP
ncbi:hypothetical protein CP966_29395 [Streptomyces galilaeus]|nr:hypothetical protein CP966_29395 [Streptomyces galilaeus]